MCHLYLKFVTDEISILDIS